MTRLLFQGVPGVADNSESLRINSSEPLRISPFESLRINSNECHPERVRRGGRVEGPAFSSACVQSLTFLVATHFRPTPIAENCRLSRWEQRRGTQNLGRAPCISARKSRGFSHRPFLRSFSPKHPDFVADHYPRLAHNQRVKTGTGKSKPPFTVLKVRNPGKAPPPPAQFS